VEAPTSAKPGDKAVITPDGRLIGWIGGSCSEPSVRREAQQVLAAGEARLVRIEPIKEPSTGARAGEIVLNTSCPSGGTLEIFLEPQLARPQLVTIGRSPAARTLIQLASLIGYRTCLVHVGATPEDFPEADQVLPHLELSTAGVGPDSWIVVATMSHYDEEALEAALRVSPAYVGLIASGRRRNALVELLRRRGWSEDALSTIVNPAGKALGDTQEEIALSELADVVERRGRRARTPTPILAPAAETAFATDPVCGMAVEIASARHRTGDHYFCSQACQETFERHEDPMPLEREPAAPA
jgi:xanthine dehydrogenase accessory factor